MTGNKEDSVVFGVAPLEGGRSTLMIGIGAGAWKYMSDGKANTIDLSSLGIPLQVIVYGAEDRAAALQVIETHNRSLGLATLDLRREDFGIKAD